MKCEIRPLKNDKQYKYEVWSPEGYCIEPDLHSLLAYNMKDARELAKSANQTLTPCEESCSCK